MKVVVFYSPVNEDALGMADWEEIAGPFPSYETALEWAKADPSERSFDVETLQVPPVRR